MSARSSAVRLVGILVCLAALPACARAAGVNPGTPAPAATLALNNCQLSSPGLPVRVEARCGTLAVPEDRASPASRQILLNVAVLPAVSRNPQPDPLFFLSGGPGQAATETFPQLAGAFELINRRRDIVLVDQRGTGKSNPLRCPEPETLDPNTLLGEDQIAQQAGACVQALNQVADLRLYTTSIAMADLDAVRAALGYETLNLYGVSYGTRAALTYLQQYPDRVRAVILDGVVPQDWDIGLHFAPDGQRALDLIFDRCVLDPACQAAFPNVRAELDDLLESLAGQPQPVTVAHPTTHEPTQVILTRTLVASTIRLLTYTPETAALIPLLIHTTHAGGDYGPLAAQFLLGNANLAATMSDGMTNSVVCSEDVHFDAQVAARSNRGSYVENSVTDLLLATCAVWPKGGIPDGFKTPVVSRAPALLLSGEADPVTPPDNAARAARTLANSFQIVVPGQGHNIIFRGCIPRLAADFIDRGTAAGLDTTCVADIRPMPFFIDFTGSAP
jgi:pimeloyl-ACP methyl ester carboxylesterase